MHDALKYPSFIINYTDVLNNQSINEQLTETLLTMCD